MSTDLLDGRVVINLQYVKNGVVTTRGAIRPEYYCWASRKKEEILTLLLSSSAIPVAYKERHFEGKDFVDGGFTDNIPVRPLVEDGFQNIIVVHLDHPTPERKDAFNKNLRGLDTNGVIFHHVWPSEDLGNILEANPTLTGKRLTYGYGDAELQLNTLLKKIEDD